MALFGNLKSEGLEESQDRLGGFSPFDSAIYAGKIKYAYAGTSSGGSTFVALVVNIDGKEYRETFYVTNKKGENFYLNPQDKNKKVPLPGFTVIDDICLIASGEPLANQETEDKVINIYDFDQKKEVPTTVPMLTGLIGKDIKLGILKQLENKNEKVGDEYVPVAATREINIVDKVFHPELNLTVAEARNGQEEAKFHDAWSERNKGTVKDKRTIKEGEGGGSGKPQRAAPQAGTSTPAKSIFGKKN